MSRPTLTGILIWVACAAAIVSNAFLLNPLFSSRRTNDCRNVNTLAMAGGFGKSNAGVGPSDSSSKKKKKTSTSRKSLKSVVDTKIPDSKDQILDTNPIPIDQLSQEHIDRFCPSLDKNYPGIRVVNSDPLILEVEDFFPAEWCDDYISRADSLGKLYQSQTFSSLTSTQRTSNTWYLKYADVPEFLQRTKALTGKQIETFEEPQIVRYEMGQQFTWHYDALPPSMKKNGGQRVATILVYLNDVDSGGATCFKDYGIQIKPQRGKALLFFPCFADGTPDDRTMHAGQVAMDTKFIAQMWLHESAYVPTIPPGSNHEDGIQAVASLPLW